MTHVSRIRDLLLTGCLLAMVPAAGITQPAPVALRAPEGLIACSAGSAFGHMAQQSLARFGELVGCYVSHDQVVLQGMAHDVSEPAEYALAVHLSAGSGPHRASEVQAMYAKAGEQWKNVKQLVQLPRKDYEALMIGLVATSAPRVDAAAAVKLEAPILVSIERIGDASYVVMSIRQRKVVQAEQAVVTRAVDATAIALAGGDLYRLSLARELRDPSDVDTVRKGMRAWLASIGSEK